MCQYVSMNNFIDYNTHLQTGDKYTFGPEKQDGYIACHHHHQGQNRPHQKIITYPHAAPLNLHKNITNFWVGVRGSYIPHSPVLRVKRYNLKSHCSSSGEKCIRVLKRKTNMIKWTSLRLTPIKFEI